MECREMIVTIPTTQKNSIKTHFKNQNIEANYPKKKKNKEFEFECWFTYDEEDLGRSVTVRSVKDFDSIVAELRV
jgi:hypothetical protein